MLIEPDARTSAWHATFGAVLAGYSLQHPRDTEITVEVWAQMVGSAVQVADEAMMALDRLDARSKRESKAAAALSLHQDGTD